MLERSFKGTLFELRLAGIPVRVEATFLLGTLLLGGARLGSLEAFAQWLLVVFLSILLHEMAHAFAGRAFGRSPEIRIYGWGGLTSWSGVAGSSKPVHDLVIALAGPLAGMVVAGACLLYRTRVDPENLATLGLLGDIVWVNGAWGLVNLLPILPLDGGVALGGLVGMVWPDRVESVTRLVSVVVACVVGGVVIAKGPSMMGVFALWLGFDSAKKWWEARVRARELAQMERLEPIFAAARAEEDGALLAATAERELAFARSDWMRKWLVETLATGRAMSGEVEAAVSALAMAPRKSPVDAKVEVYVVRLALAARRTAALGGDPGEAVSSPGDGADWLAAVSFLRDPEPEKLDAVLFGRVREVAEVLKQDSLAARLGEVLLERAADPDLAFAVACAWMRAGQPKRADRFAAKAVELGFRDWQSAERAPGIARPGGAYDKARQEAEAGDWRPARSATCE